MKTCVLVLLIALAGAAPAEDEVHILPGFGVPPTPQYSGFLDAKGTATAPGCAATEAVCQVHYWYAAAEGPDAAQKPVVLWLNGGPGSSSVLGMLTENGPLLTNSSGGLMVNPYSWTRLAHFFVLESPMGVGYSYCSTQAAGGVCKNTDKLTASSARAAVVDFFTRKFAELRRNKLYITGESYAGVYVPTLAQEILSHAPPGVVNLAGLAVGDPCTDQAAQADSMDMLWYGHKNGFIPDQDYDLLWNKCRVRQPSVMGERVWSWGRGETARDFFARAMGRVHTGRRVAAAAAAAAAAAGAVVGGDHDDDDDAHYPGNMQNTTECRGAYRRYLGSTSRGFSQVWTHAWINDATLYGPSALVSFLPGGSSLYAKLTTWMQRKDVREALHVEAAPIDTWPTPAAGFDYTKQYRACNAFAPPGTPSMVDFYREVAPKLEAVVVYNGDTDPCVSYEGTRTALTRVGFAELQGGSYRPWFYNHTAVGEAVLREKPPLFGPDLSLTGTGAQVGGLVVNYEHGLSFVTVHGSGHMVPQFRPQAALHLLRKVLDGAPLSPLTLPNATLAAMSDEDFNAALDKWTVEAKGAPYVQ